MRFSTVDGMLFDSGDDCDSAARQERGCGQWTQQRVQLHAYAFCVEVRATRAHLGVTTLLSIEKRGWTEIVLKVCLVSGLLFDGLVYSLQHHPQKQETPAAPAAAAATAAALWRSYWFSPYSSRVGYWYILIQRRRSGAHVCSNV